MEHITKAILSDQNGAVLDILLTADGPAYTCRRYWDWFEPFIAQLITDGYSGTKVSVTMMEVCFRILGNFEKINTTFKLKIMSYYAREPYLIWSITESRDIKTVPNELKKFHVVASEFTTQISASIPNPAEQTNENLKKVTRAGWLNSFQLVASPNKT